MKFTLASISFLVLSLLPACTTTHGDVSSSEHASASAGGDMQLPPGWTAEDMAAMTKAGTPGAQHAALRKNAGKWSGTCTMWMAPNTTPTTSPCTSIATPVFDGRYLRVECTTDMAGMGTFNGIGHYGYDNVAQKYVSTWVDNMGTGMTNGTGTSTDGGRTIAWRYEMNCPIRKGPTTMREIESHPTDDTMTLEAYTSDVKTGQEFLTMKMELKRVGS